MSLFKKGKLGSKSGDDGAEDGANPEIEAQAEASAAADAEIAAAETQAETQAGAGGMPPAAAGADLGKPELGAAGALDPAAGGGDDLSFDDGLGDSSFDDFDDDYVPQPAASKKKFLIATIGLIVLAGGSFALMNMMGGSDGPPPPPPPSQQVTQATPQDNAPPSLPGGNEAAPGLPMPEPAQNTGMGVGPDLALGDEGDAADLPPLSPPGMPPQTATADAPPTMPMPMPTPGDEYGADDGGLDLPAMPDMDEPEMADAGDMMSPPDLPGMPPLNADMAGDDMGGDDMMSAPDFPMPPMGDGMDAGMDNGPDMAAGDDVMSPPDLPGMPSMDTGPDMSPPDLGGPDLGMPDLPMPDATDTADAGMASPGDADLGMLDDLDSAMAGGAPPMPGAETGTADTGGMNDLLGEEPSLAETLGADLAPMPVTGDEAMPPPSDDLAALMTAPDDGLDELNLLDELDDAGPADMGIAGAADDIVDTGRSRGRLNLDDLAVEQPLTPVFPRNTSKYLNVQKDYSSSSARAQVESAQRALKEGRDSLALELFDALYVKHPKDPRIMMGRAVALQKNGMVDEAVDAYEKVLKRDPRNVNALTNMLGLIRMTDPDKALTKLLDLKATYPGRPAILAQLGMTYADVGDEESAMRYLRMAQDLEPEDPRHAFNMAVLMDRRGHTPEAIMNYKRALFLNSNAGGNLVPTTAIQQRLDALR